MISMIGPLRKLLLLIRTYIFGIRCGLPLAFQKQRYTVQVVSTPKNTNYRKKDMVEKSFQMK